LSWQGLVARRAPSRYAQSLCLGWSANRGRAMTRFERGHEDHHRCHTPGTLQAMGSKPTLVPGRVWAHRRGNIPRGTRGFVPPIPREEHGGDACPQPLPKATPAVDHDDDIASQMRLAELLPPVRAPGRITSSEIRHPIHPATLAHEFLGYPDSARQPHGKNTVRAVHPMPLGPHYDRSYRQDFEQLMALERFRVHPLTINRR
jgi:hypothetical protein